MKRFLLIGKSGSGKTSLLQRLYGRELEDQKTQTVESFGASIDTPGEYLERKNLFHALVVTAVDCDEILLVQAVDDADSSFPPGIDACLNRPVTGVVTKTDLVDDGARLDAAAAQLREAGASRIVSVSAKTGAGLEALRTVVFEESGETAPARAAR